MSSVGANLAAGYSAGAAFRERNRQERERNALAQILKDSYETPEPTPVPFVSEEEQAMGLPPTQGLTASYRQDPGSVNMDKAYGLMVQRGMGPEALAFQSQQRDAQLKNLMAQAQLRNAMALKAPTTRQIPVDDQGTIETQEWSPQTGQWSSVAKGKRQMPEWMLPGYIDTQRKLAEAKGEGRMSPTAQKELFEADDLTQSATNVIDLLGRAKQLNSQAYSGPFAKQRAQATNFLPGDYSGANATVDLDNIMTGQALESLKAIFGGMPTEGERKILLDMQASADKTPQQRESILNRAMELAQRRMQFNKSKAEAIRKGSYFKEGASPVQTPPAQPSPQGQTPKLQSGKTIQDGYIYMGGDPSKQESWKPLR